MSTISLSVEAALTFWEMLLTMQSIRQADADLFISSMFILRRRVARGGPGIGGDGCAGLHKIK